MSDDPLAAEIFGLMGHFEIPLVLSAAGEKGSDRPIIAVNRAFCELTEYGDWELLGRDCRMLQGPQSQGPTRRRLREALDAGTAVEGIITNYRKSGKPFENYLFIFPVHDPSRRLAYFMASQLEIPRFNKVDALERHAGLLGELGAEIRATGAELRARTTESARLAGESVRRLVSARIRSLSSREREVS